VTPEAQIVRDLGAESINIAEIAVAIENEFDLEVDAASIQKGLTVAGLTSMVQEALAAK